MKVIYIAGKYRDPRGEFYIDANIREARREAVFVWASGGIALCPHLNTAFFGGAFNIPDETWLQGDLELLKRCDAVFTVDNYITSKGALAEIEYAKSLNIPVLYNHAEVLKFLGTI